MPWLAGLLGAIGPWFFNLMKEKGPKLFASFLGSLGLVIVTNELLMDNVVDVATSAWGGIPGNFACWLGAVGVTKMASICLSALTLLGAKKLFFGKKAA